MLLADWRKLPERWVNKNEALRWCSRTGRTAHITTENWFCPLNAAQLVILQLINRVIDHRYFTMAPTVKVWNLPKLRCNCSSDISCSPSLVWSHGRAAGSLPHPAPSPSIVLCSSVTLLWDQFTGVDWLPCPSSLRPIASCACAHPTSAWLILIAVIQSGNLLQPWGDVNDIPQTSGVQRNRKSNFSKSLTMNFLLMFNSRQNRH